VPETIAHCMKKEFNSIPAKGLRIGFAPNDCSCGTVLLTLAKPAVLYISTVSLNYTTPIHR